MSIGCVGGRCRSAGDQLTAWLGVSRTPVREAIARLVVEGFVEMAADRYTKVSSLSVSGYDYARQSSPVLASPRQSSPVLASPRQSSPACTDSRSSKRPVSTGRSESRSPPKRPQLVAPSRRRT
ncbi:GntR family transcriptional regulator [Curtobacterium sp. MCBD17_032]|uniref:GntR family transcriptional regulator n=1 Tax=Curtobacterium sp. MCBD17_032 TaxID=2175659 RepID=UPI000DA8D313|nr:GntR family transcriptional regulator [Curtobacterium sp. MCBD17_032]PZE86780.1 hypothetical protein DEI91_00260 [Curtobacterium sp. MCBD17_032]